MDMDKHDFELDELIERIKSNDNRLVALQVPEGLKMQALDMMDSIEEETSAKIILAADPCYGACDLVHDKMHMQHSFPCLFQYLTPQCSQIIPLRM